MPCLSLSLSPEDTDKKNGVIENEEKKKEENSTKNKRGFPRSEASNKGHWKFPFPWFYLLCSFHVDKVTHPLRWWYKANNNGHVNSYTLFVPSLSMVKLCLDFFPNCRNSEIPQQHIITWVAAYLHKMKIQHVKWGKGMQERQKPQQKSMQFGGYLFISNKWTPSISFWDFYFWQKIKEVSAFEK